MLPWVRVSWLRLVLKQETFNYFHSTSLQPGVQMGTGELTRKPDEMLGGHIVMD